MSLEHILTGSYLKCYTFRIYILTDREPSRLPRTSHEHMGAGIAKQMAVPTKLIAKGKILAQETLILRVYIKAFDITFSISIATLIIFRCICSFLPYFCTFIQAREIFEIVQFLLYKQI